jgi:hypothetical protein
VGEASSEEVNAEMPHLESWREQMYDSPDTALAAYRKETEYLQRYVDS